MAASESVGIGRGLDREQAWAISRTGGRVRAQLIGKKAAKCAEAIEAAQRASGEKRVVVGLVGVKARRPKAPSDAPAVWDPKEESELILRPDHPSAEKL